MNYICIFSLIEFFKKIKKWADMANLPQEFRDRIDRLERNFAVSTVIFKKYRPIFMAIFRNPAECPVRPPRGRKQRFVVDFIQPILVDEMLNVVRSGGRTKECQIVIRGDSGSIPPAAVSKLRQFRSPHICLCLSEETKSRWSRLSGVYARGSKRSHTGGKCVTCTVDSQILIGL